MKKALFFITVISALIATSSCVKTSSEYKALKAQNDSLLLANAHSETELEEILALFNEVEANFDSIKTAENYLNVQSNTPGEFTPSVKERVRADMQLVTNILTKNKEKIAELESKLKNSSVKSAQFQKTVESLRAELENKTKSLVALNAELERKDRQISDLTANVSALSKDVEKLVATTDAQQQTIAEQQKEINTAYYCYGTTKELKEMNVLKNGEITTTFNRDDFIKVPNITQLKQIMLHSKKAKLLSKHPEGSYEITKDDYNQALLKILDPKTFWSMTKYLVVEVKV